ncbi:MAG: polyphosphate polymerase domain-containing protein [Leucobacter sp.]
MTAGVGVTAATAAGAGPGADAHAVPVLPLADLAPSRLDEVVAEAALLTRVDRKYLVPMDIAVSALDRLDPATRVLEIDGLRDFGYDTVYFDTADRLSYRLTAQRRRRRFKLRTRSYLDTGTSFLELKTKSGRGATVKDRIPYDPADRARITEAGGSYIAELLGRHGHEPGLVGELRPCLVSRYRRATLLVPGGTRVTVDTGLSWTEPGGDSLELPHHAIIETKSASSAGEFDRRLWRLGHRPSGISKFGTGTAALRPELPNNKWARALRGPFTGSATRTTTEGTS